MGIFINVYVSDSVTKEEWASVYEESLTLVDKFPLAEIMKKTIEGVDVYCIVPTEERIIERRSNSEGNEKYGWYASKDYNNLRGAETQVLYRDLTNSGQNTVDEFHDPILNVAKEQLSLSSKIKDYFDYRLFGNKTQGESYHVYLLGIACLIADRLGDKAFVCGDITRGQCKIATKEVNNILKNHIKLPVQCDPDRFMYRISKLSLTDTDKLKVFEHFFLGNKDAEFGKCLRKYFNERTCTNYWKSYFKNIKMRTIGFRKLFKEYILLGFDLEKLCHFVNFNEKKDSDYEEFINYVLDAKLHIKNKNSEHIFEIDNEAERTYGIMTLLSQLFLVPKSNRSIDRYIPIEEIRMSLKKGIGKNFDVDSYIDKYLEKEKKEQENKNNEDNKSNVKDNLYDGRNELEKEMSEYLNDYQKQSGKYDIVELDQVIMYKSGDKISPEIDKLIKNFFEQYNKLLNFPTSKYQAFPEYI